MNFPSLNQFYPAIPEILLLSMACIVLVVDLLVSDRHRYLTYVTAQLSLLITLVSVWWVSGQTETVVLGGAFVMDSLAAISKLFLLLITAGVFIYARPYLQDRGLNKGEFYVLGLFAALGMMIMVSGHSMLTLYLGLELLSLSLYAMVAFNRDSAIASEAAMKYFVLGALASGMLLYGISLFYGITGSLDVAAIGSSLAESGTPDVPTLIALSFIVIGLAFKFGAVPFHMWVPDIYHGSPTAVTVFIGSAPKIAAFGMTMRILADSMHVLHGDWSQMLVLLAILSLALGNVVAIAQTNIKRMLAYSTISHVGFILLGILSATSDGYAASLFYVITYAIMALGAFGVVMLLSRKGFEAENLEDFKGLSSRSPWLAFLMMILMFSMAGVPPTVGFYAKLAVLQAVVSIDMTWLAVVAVFFSIIGAFYYLRVIKLMYFDEATDSARPCMAMDTWLAITANGLAVLVLGIFPGGLMDLCFKALA